MKLLRFFLLCLLFIPLFAYADVTQWQIVPSKSHLTFTGTQNDAPVTGAFDKFSGDIYFDALDLAGSHVNIVVDTNSLSASYGDLVDTLKTPDWFNVKLFPAATFKASSFTKTSDKTYDAKGTLTIRDKTVPVVVTFVIEEMTNTNAQVKGSTILKRNAFGVGQGEWASVEEVKDDVKVDFILSVIKK